MTSSNRTNTNQAGVRTDDTSHSFWERVYASKTTPSGGRPSAALTRFVGDRRPGRALDLGCARGDDAIWLAQQSWSVTGVDIAETALLAARQTAAAQGVADRVSLERHDLAETFPEGRFDLVIAMFLQSPLPFARTRALRRAAEAVDDGGLLLVVTHGSHAPWSWSDPDTQLPTAEDELADLALDPDSWRDVFVGSLPRTANGPQGQQAVVLDTIVAIERRATPENR